MSSLSKLTSAHSGDQQQEPPGNSSDNNTVEPFTTTAHNNSSSGGPSHLAQGGGVTLSVPPPRSTTPPLPSTSPPLPGHLTTKQPCVQIQRLAPFWCPARCGVVWCALRVGVAPGVQHISYLLPHNPFICMCVCSMRPIERCRPSAAAATTRT